MLSLKNKVFNSAKAVGAIVVLPALLSLLFAYLRYTTWDTTYKFPTIVAILKAFIELFSLDSVGIPNAIYAMCVTIGRVAGATFLSLIVALLCSLAIAWRPILWSLFQPSMDLLRSIPVTFFLPFFAVATGTLASEIPIVLAAIPCTLIMLLQFRQGLSGLSKARLHTFGLLAGRHSTLLRLRYVVAPEILPEMIAGLRLATSYAIVVISVLEYMNIGSEMTGFGSVIAQLQQSKPTDPLIFAGVLLFGFLGFGINRALESLENRLSVWRNDHAS